MVCVHVCVRACECVYPPRVSGCAVKVEEKVGVVSEEAGWLLCSATGPAQTDRAVECRESLSPLPSAVLEKWCGQLAVPVSCQVSSNTDRIRIFVSTCAIFICNQVLPSLVFIS